MNWKLAIAVALGGLFFINLWGLLVDTRTALCLVLAGLAWGKAVPAK